MSENLADKGTHEHYKLVRESPEYRMSLMMEELQAEMQPPWGSREEELPDSNNISITDKNMGDRGYGGKGEYYTPYLDMKIRGLNLHLEKIEDFVRMVMPIIERQKIPVKLVEIPMPKRINMPVITNAVGVGQFLRLKSEFLYWQSKLIKHLDKGKKKESIWTNDGHEMDKV